MSTYLDANNETCDLPLVLVIPQLLQWYVKLVLTHFLDQNSEYLIKIETFIMIQILEFPHIR
jgi:hypothetical protein